MSVDADAEATTTRAPRRDVDGEREETVRYGRRAPATARAATTDGMTPRVGVWRLGDAAAARRRSCRLTARFTSLAAYVYVK